MKREGHHTRRSEGYTDGSVYLLFQQGTEPCVWRLIPAQMNGPVDGECGQTGIRLVLKGDVFTRLSLCFALIQAS